MRIGLFELRKYGKFDSVTVPLPKLGKRDIHLVIGENEAGKSTMRNALTDFLYGIEERTVFGFRYGNAALELAGELEHDGAQLAFSRLKKRKNSIEDAAGKAIDDAMLAPFIGPTDREFWARMFCLDHPQMEKGGKAILEAKDDTARTIFQAATGLDAVSKVLEQLRNEANTLFSKQRHSERTYWSAEARLAQADEALKAALVRAKEWTEARTAHEERLGELESLRAAVKGNDSKRSKLERARRIAPYLQQERELTTELGALGQAPLLPADAAERLDRASQDISLAQNTISRDRDRLAAIESGIARLERKPEVLRVREAMSDFVSGANAVAGHIPDIPKRSSEAAGHEGEALKLAAGLGIYCADAAALESVLPTLGARANLSTHAACFAAVDTGAKRANQTVTDCAERKREAQDLVDAMPAAVDLAPVIAAAATSRALGAIDTLRPPLVQRIQASKSKLAGEIRKLGTDHAAAALSDMKLPGTDEAVEAHAAFRAREQVRVTAEGRAADATVEATAAETEVLRVLQEQQPVTPEEIAKARWARDAEWQRIRDGEESAAAAALQFEGLVTAADQVADRRFDGSQQAHALTAAQSNVEKRRHAVKLADEALTNATASRDEVVTAWNKKIVAAGGPELPLPRSIEWLKQRSVVIDAAEDTDLLEAELRAFDGRSQAAAESLRCAMEQCKVSAPVEAALTGLLQLAEDAIARARNDAAARDKAVEAARVAAMVLTKAETAKAEAAKALADWQSSWSKVLTAVGLPAETSAAAGLDALETLNGIAQSLRSAKELRNRVARMEEDLARVRSSAAVVAAAMGQPADAALGELAAHASSQLKAADVAEAAYGQLNEQRESAMNEIDGAETAQGAAQARVAPLLEACGAPGLAELRIAIQASDRKRKLSMSLDDVRKNALAAGDGLAMADLEAELAALHVATVEADIKALSEELMQLQARRDDLVLAEKEARVKLEAIAGGSAAAEAESRRQEALADMAAAAERYIKLKTAARVLTWSIDRYREEQQSPLLKLASSKFSDITAGAFAQLRVDHDADDPLILAQRAGTSEIVTVEGLSSGTRDQLYLTLRLAAVEQHLQRAHALPFIADDLFINFSENRVECGLALLGALAESTQVIYLTHHQHVLEAAQKLFGSDLNVIKLPA